MADFSTPFGSTSDKRLPTSDEKTNGMQCGPADRTLFNGLFNRLEAEMNSIVQEAGTEATDGSNDAVVTAINALISAATGGNPAGYVLMSQVRSRLPIFPEIINADGRIVISSPSTGVIRIPGGVDFVHRGVFNVTTTQTDLNTDASKTYHIRWNPTDGFTLNDLASNVYNSGSASETSDVFDSTYDDMLISRVVTNSSNVATITNLSNKHQLKTSGEMVVPAQTYEVTSPSALQNYEPVELNWARKPLAWMSSGTDLTMESGSVTGETNMGAKSIDRYKIGVFWQRKETPGASYIAYVAGV